MNKVIVIANQKGGVGKTTTVINLTHALALKEKKILIIDMDPQGNAGVCFNIDIRSCKTIYDALINELSLSEIILHTDFSNIDFVPSNDALSGAQIELVNVIAREQVLKNILQPYIEKYDYIFIDTPPSLCLLTINAFTAAHSILIPIQCEYLALEGIAQLLKTIKLVKHSLNPDLSIEGVCLTMYDTRTNLSKEVMENVVGHFKEKTYKTIIPRNIKLSEAPSFGKPITTYSPESPGAVAYKKLAEEFIIKNITVQQ